VIGDWGKCKADSDNKYSWRVDWGDQVRVFAKSHRIASRCIELHRIASHHIMLHRINCSQPPTYPPAPMVVAASV
jgi:hypothetical protein